MAAEVVDARDQRRYEIRDEGEMAGFAAYILTGELITLTHTEIDPAHEGKGLGGTLVRGALDDARSRDLAVLPLCPFVKGWIQRHPDYSDLVYHAPHD
ncbi:GNAT family N-acetyltransferase [Nocardiopsis quinghaiensis]|uniref:GNAT family N-acetyltransferase n=1 Tax=Nocardiopsis quinghaiensis TaxID=464995 RepID=UPI00123C2B22|nr:GNAT family N-acetyltransferase [Nocardiopsis quinghaiensis]